MDNNPCLTLFFRLLPVLFLFSCTEHREQEQILLKPGDLFELEVNEESPTRLFVSLNKGDFLELKVQQQGIDCEISITEPNTSNPIIIDGHTECFGEEYVLLHADRDGLYAVVIRSLYDRQKDGRAILRVIQAGPAGVSADLAALNRRAELFRAFFSKTAETWVQDFSNQEHDTFPQLKAYKAAAAGYRLSQSSQFKEAAAAWQVALDAFLELEQPEAAFWAENKLANQHYKQGALGEAFAWKGRLQREALARGLVSISSHIGAERAYYLFESGHIQQALLAAEETLAQTRNSQDQEALAKSLLELGVMYSSMGRTDSARDFLEQALDIYKLMSHPATAARTATEIGWTYYLDGDYPKAIEKYQTALRLAENSKDSAAYGGALDRLASAYRELGRYSEAQKHYNLALENLTRPVEKAHVHTNIAESFVDMDRYQESLNELDIAARYFAVDPNKAALAHLAFLRAQSLKGLHDKEGALEAVTLAVNHLQTLREQVSLADHGHPLTALRMGYSRLYLDLLYQAHLDYPNSDFHSQAFLFADRLRGEYLMRKAMARADNSDLSMRRAVLQYIDFLEHQEQLATYAQEKNERLERMMRVHLETKQIAEHREGETPAYPDLKQIQSVIPEDTALLSYFLGPKHTYLWVIDHQQIHMLQLKDSRTIQQKSRQWFTLISSPVSSDDPQSIILGKELSRDLLAAVPNLDRYKHLQIIKDEAVANLPFGALPHPTKGTYLAETHTVNQLYAAGHLYLNALNPKPSDNGKPRALVITDPVFSKDDPRLHPETDPIGTPQDRLISTALEREYLKPLIHKDSLSLSGFDANLETFRQAPIEQFDLIHIATHGYQNQKHGALSRVLLSCYNQKGQAIKANLRAQELEAMALNANLVTLSSCRTARSQNLQGQGGLGFVASLLGAGARQVMGGLWNVDDQATAELMIRFYHHHLENRLPAGQALRFAQLDLMKDDRYQAPYYWAGFEIFGSQVSEKK